MDNLKNEKALKIASNVLFAVGIVVALLIGIMSGFVWEKSYGGSNEIEAVNWAMWGIAILVGVFTSAFAYMLTVIAEISTTLKNRQQ